MRLLRRFAPRKDMCKHCHCEAKGRSNLVENGSIIVWKTGSVFSRLFARISFSLSYESRG
jgi:hypothetical protein